MKRQLIGRYYTKRERRWRYFKPSDFEDGYLKENAEEIEEQGPFTDVFVGQLPDALPFLAHAECLIAWAGLFLRARGLPDCYWVSFPPERPEEWEECEPLEVCEPLEALRLPPGRNFRRLDWYLREYCGVQDDEAEDLAARIVCTVHGLKRAEDNNLAMHLAYELGELSILSHIYEEEDRRRKKRRKRKGAVWDELLKSLGDASNNKEEAWSAIPESEEDEIHIEAGGVQWRVYRDGDYVCAVDDRTGDAKKPIKRETFFKYFTRKVSD